MNHHDGPTAANLSVHLAARRREAMRWFLDRLPSESQPTEVIFGVVYPVLSWAKGPRVLDLIFETPHRVRFEQYDMGGLRDGQTSGPPIGEGTLNLAMNLQELIDLVSRAFDGKVR